jgi:hypothetical protein
MKLTNLTKSILAASALTVASFGANAGVMASSTLEVSKFTVLFDVNGNGDFTDDNPADYPIVGIVGERDGATSAGWGNDSAANNPAAGGASATIDASLSCAGPDCGAMALTENGIFTNNVDLVSWADSTDYAFGDMRVEGNAFDATGSTGFTQAEAAIGASSNVTGTANASIFNNLAAILNFTTTATIDAMIKIDYVTSLSVALSDDVIADDTIFGKASGSYKLGISVDSASVIDVSNAMSTLDNSALAGTTFQKNNETTATTTVFSSPLTLLSGTHAIVIDQFSKVDVSLVPEPASVAILGLGLLGFAGAARRRKS